MLEVNASGENNTSEEKRKAKWLTFLVLLLIFLLVGQTCAVIYFLNRKEKTAQTAAAGAPGYAYPPYAPQRLSGNSAASAPASRRRAALNAYPPRDPFVDDALDSMNRLEDHLTRMVSRFMAAAPSMEELFGGADTFDFMPTMDLGEKGSEYIVKADLPGLDKSQIDISVKGDLLTLKGVRSSESKTTDDQSGVYKQERSYGSFARSLRLPGPVDENKISADYQNGVLTIHLPKAAENPNSKKIEIQ